MAYKRYFYKNGRKLGPYYYESYRDETGKVKKRYIGTEDPNKKEDQKDIDSSLMAVTPTGSKIKLLVFMLIFLILMDISVVVYLF